MLFGWSEGDKIFLQTFKRVATNSKVSETKTSLICVWLYAPVYKRWTRFLVFSGLGILQPECWCESCWCSVQERATDMCLAEDRRINATKMQHTAPRSICQITLMGEESAHSCWLQVQHQAVNMSSLRDWFGFGASSVTWRHSGVGSILLFN